MAISKKDKEGKLVHKQLELTWMYCFLGFLVRFSLVSTTSWAVKPSQGPMSPIREQMQWQMMNAPMVRAIEVSRGIFCEGTCASRWESLTHRGKVIYIYIYIRVI